ARALVPGTSGQEGPQVVRGGVEEDEGQIGLGRVGEVIRVQLEPIAELLLIADDHHLRAGAGRHAGRVEQVRAAVDHAADVAELDDGGDAALADPSYHHVVAGPAGGGAEQQEGCELFHGT